ncbi:MAG TPA: hypothetical protein GX714_10650 [Chloroflexi bacterium]|jgi:hypothetical protein|nr:hypothetical protein [Chloroflexota bacterium]
MADLLAAYPRLGEAISELCAGQSWRFTGASVLVRDATHLYLEITKPRHWHRRADGTLVAGIGAIGGSLEGDEGVLACLRREVAEEIDSSVILRPATETHLVYEQRAIRTVALPPSRPSAAERVDEVPAPVLCTVSRNLYRRQALPDAQVLAIATFWAELTGPPRLGDLFGLLALPRDALETVLAVPPPSVAAVRSIPGVRLTTRRPMEGDALLAPVWTTRSLQILLQAGRLRWPSTGPAAFL